MWDSTEAPAAFDRHQELRESKEKWDAAVSFGADKAVKQPLMLELVRMGVAKYGHGKRFFCFCKSNWKTPNSAKHCWGCHGCNNNDEWHYRRCDKCVRNVRNACRGCGRLSNYLATINAMRNGEVISPKEDEEEEDWKLRMSVRIRP